MIRTEMLSAAGPTSLVLDQAYGDDWTVYQADCVDVLRGLPSDKLHYCIFSPPFAIRRCWRFGQTEPVDAYLVASELEGAVVANLRRKERDFEAMLDAMAGHMRDLMRESVLGHSLRTEYNPTMPMEIPAWL